MPRGSIVSTLSKRKWTDEEDKALVQLVAAHGQCPEAWKIIAESFPQRNTKQCRERYLHHLNPRVDKGPWTIEEEKFLFQLQSVVGNSWTDISRYLPGRSEATVKNRYYSALRRVERAHRVPGQVAAELLADYARKSLSHEDNVLLSLIQSEIRGGAYIGPQSLADSLRELGYHEEFNENTLADFLAERSGAVLTTISTIKSNENGSAEGAGQSSYDSDSGLTTTRSGRQIKMRIDMRKALSEGEENIEDSFISGEREVKEEKFEGRSADMVAPTTSSGQGRPAIVPPLNTAAVTGHYSSTGEPSDSGSGKGVVRVAALPPPRTITTPAGNTRRLQFEDFVVSAPIVYEKGRGRATTTAEPYSEPISGSVLAAAMSIVNSPRMLSARSGSGASSTSAGESEQRNALGGSGVNGSGSQSGRSGDSGLSDPHLIGLLPVSSTTPRGMSPSPHPSSHLSSNSTSHSNSNSNSNRSSPSILGRRTRLGSTSRAHPLDTDMHESPRTSHPSSLSSSSSRRGTDTLSSTPRTAPANDGRVSPAALGAALAAVEGGSGVPGVISMREGSAFVRPRKHDTRGSSQAAGSNNKGSISNGGADSYTNPAGSKRRRTRPAERFTMGGASVGNSVPAQNKKESLVKTTVESHSFPQIGDSVGLESELHSSSQHQSHSHGLVARSTSSTSVSPYNIDIHQGITLTGEKSNYQIGSHSAPFMNDSASDSSVDRYFSSHLLPFGSGSTSSNTRTRTPNTTVDHNAPYSIPPLVSPPSLSYDNLFSMAPGLLSSTLNPTSPNYSVGSAGIGLGAFQPFPVSSSSTHYRDEHAVKI